MKCCWPSGFTLRLGQVGFVLQHHLVSYNWWANVKMDLDLIVPLLVCGVVTNVALV